MSTTAGNAGEWGDAAERAYRTVLSMILLREVTEGEWLREANIAERIGLSRTPVREAFKRLAVEGAVELHPSRGVKVVSLSADEVDSLLDLRVRFEPLAVKLAVSRLAPAQIAELEALCTQITSLLKVDALDWQELPRLNNEFHTIFIQNCGNRHLALAIQTVVRPVIVARTFQTYSRHGLERSMRHHAELVDAVRAGDGDWAKAVMKSHILAARRATN